MNLIQLKQHFYDKFQENPSNSVFSPEKVLRWINEGYQAFLNYHLWDFLLTEHTMTNIFTLCSPHGVSEGIHLYVESAQGIQAGMKIFIIGNNGITEAEAEEVDFTLNHILLQPPGLLSPAQSKDKILCGQLFLPYDCRQLLSISRLSVKNPYTAGRKLECIPPADLENIKLKDIKAGAPCFYAKGGIDHTAHSWGEYLEMEEHTSPLMAVSSAAAHKEEGYFNGWKLINVSRKMSSRIKSFSAGGVFHLASPIEGQTAGDLFFMVRGLNKIALYPLPDKSYTYSLLYYAAMPDLYNDWDTPVMGEKGQEDLLLDYALGEAYASDRQPELSAFWKQKYFSRIEKMKRDSLSFEEKDLRFKVE